MEEQKLRSLRAFLHRTKLSLEGCISFIRGLEDRVRNCYVERVNLTSDDFVKMILVDSSFIIEVIWRYNYSLTEENETHFLNRQIMLLDVIREDMILLENQIPYFVLEGLFNLAFPSSSGVSSFVSLSVYYFASISLLNVTNIPNHISNSQVKHFVDLLRLCHLPSVRRPQPPKTVSFMAIPTARDLREAGLSFRKGSSNNILDIEYAKGVIKIPRFDIQDSSEIVFRNLIAFEMCHYHNDSYIIDYVVFMDTLTDTVQDVDILVDNGIFENSLMDRASVTTFFHSLTSEVLWSSHHFYYNRACQHVNAYCKVPWHKWKAIMKHDYFSTPWRIISIVAAIVLLVLTFIQTICSLIPILQEEG
ncbi:hypothetical protein Vadar_031395 [Vaccinium darrowii]|uniref:Uncharacterized protein n=1 Tax=Vaccinium darrowii TaxID=229202 RepID=A0ACB7XL90_9ERIC|nr:hypothetical protein Vadar_031395 [Vaccinium darrowii]